MAVQQRRCRYCVRDNGRLWRCAEIRTRKLPPGLLDSSLRISRICSRMGEYPIGKEKPVHSRDERTSTERVALDTASPARKRRFVRAYVSPAQLHLSWIHLLDRLELLTGLGFSNVEILARPLVPYRGYGDTHEEPPDAALIL